MASARILIVEDESIVALDLSSRLALLGYEVVGNATRGEQAIALADQLRPDLVLMDIRLDGEMDGISAAERIHHSFRLPVVFLTANAEDDTLARARVAEPFGYILKPFEDRELKTIIEIALYKHLADEEIRRLQRLYATLSQVNQTIVRVQSRAELFPALVRIAIEFGHFEAAQIHACDPTTQTLTLLEKAGADFGPPFSAQDATASPCQARWVWAGAVLGRTSICNDVLRECPEEDVCEQARRSAIRSVVAVPFRFQGKVCGVLSLAAAESGFFQAPEIKLTEEITLDISFALDQFEAAEQQRRTEAALHRIEWMLTKGSGPEAPGKPPREPYTPAYGDLLPLNRSRLILDAVGAKMLADIVGDYLDLLDTSAAVYERNGDYALGIFSSGWCRFMDHASRSRCGTEDNRVALACGKWLCHESCWAQASRKAIESNGPVDIACEGGIHLYALPIRAGGKIVGAINVGYGDPPCDTVKLQELALKYGVADDELVEHARAYESRPPYIIDLAKRRLAVSARLIGEIIERKQARQERAKALALVEAAIAQSPSGILIADAPDVTIRWANRAALGIRGETELPLTGIDIRRHASHWQVFHPDGTPYPPEALPLSRAVLQGEVTHNEELIIRNAQGEDRWVAANAAPIRNGDGAITSGIVVFHDITERRQTVLERDKLQAQLVQSQKMESVGRLAGGVAHDFNNMLQAILGNVDLAMQQTPASSQVRENLDEIQKAAQRSADLTRQLLAFARKQTVSPKVLDLSQTVSGMLKMLQRLIGEDIKLEWLPGSELWSVKVDPSQIDQVLANLAVNARDAIHGMGQITIETSNVTLDETCSQIHLDCVPGDYVLLAVSDTGQGMDADTQSHLFEPFFTTKELGKGTGLGLATVFGIVKQNHGLINVSSEPGQGTVIQIYLPRAQAEVVVGEQKAARQSLPCTETVLLVEDEEQILNMGRRILQQQGYTVLAALTPEAALALAKEHPEPISLLITDVVMLGMNGKQMWERLRESQPQVKCLFMSGYTADVIARHGVLEDDVSFLQKPFTIRNLADKVREVLEQRVEPPS